MALPTTISGVTFLATQSQGRSRPYISSTGNIYCVFRNGTTNTDLDIYKATDPTVAFSQVGSLTLNANGLLLGIGTFQERDNLHIATQDNNEAILYHVFSMSSDSFTTSNEAVTSAVGTNIDIEKAIQISLETGGDIIIFYQGASDQIKGAKERVDRAFKVGGSWTVDQAVDDGGEVHYFLGGIVRGKANKFHLVFKDDTNADVLHKSVQDVDGTLNSVEILNDSDMNVVDFPVAVPVFYDDEGAEIVTTGWNRTTFMGATEVVDDGVPESVTTLSSFIANRTNQFSILSLAVDVKTVWAIIARSGNDIYSTSNVDRAGWDLDLEELNGITCKLITSNSYQRGSDVVLAYIYDDDGTIKYNEKVLRSVIPTRSRKSVAGSSSKLGLMF